MKRFLLIHLNASVMQKGFSLFAPMLGTIIFVIAVLVSMNVVNTEISVASAAINKLNKERCVLVSDLVSAGEATMINAQVADVLTAASTSVTEGTRRLDVAGNVSLIKLEDRRDYIDRNTEVFLEDAKLAAVDGILGFATWLPTLYANLEGCSFPVDENTISQVSKAVTVRKTDRGNLVLSLDENVLRGLSISLGSRDSAENWLISDIDVFGSSYTSKQPYVQFMRAAAAGVYEGMHLLNEGAYARDLKSSGQIEVNYCIDTGNEILLNQQFAASDYYDDFIIPLEERIEDTANNYVGDGYHVDCRISGISSLSTQALRFEAVQSDYWYLLGGTVTCNVIDDSTDEVLLRAENQEPFYIRHNAYKKNPEDLIKCLAGCTNSDGKSSNPCLNSGFGTQ